ncbi:DUF4328 domain-containing protein [Kordia algicida OT-1]|uniref:DUF4328 domain-containing protein n=1 Tax=Kordia algicida OT-1 TaxID=391587 RepID=A9E8Y0_9FLAO|nr:DUF4328 domain-containing protein [Kordia algicida]EDP94831.1 hypothetical protein KAOT1_01355 [Kordia algicida OT-1]
MIEDELKDNSQRSKDITMVFITAICIDAISILLLIFQSYKLKNFTNTEDEMAIIELLDIFVPISGIAQFVIFIVAVIFFLRWFTRAYENLIIKNQKTDYSKAGSAWGFFIPIVSLYRPITTAKEIYLKTQYAIKGYNSNFKVDTDTSFIVIWWIVYIVNGIFANYVSRKQVNAFDIDSFVESNGYLIVSDIINIITLVLVLYVIHKITKVETVLRETNESVSEIDEIGKTVVY